MVTILPMYPVTVVLQSPDNVLPLWDPVNVIKNEPTSSDFCQRLNFQTYAHTSQKKPTPLDFDEVPSVRNLTQKKRQEQR